MSNVLEGAEVTRRVRVMDLERDKEDKQDVMFDGKDLGISTFAARPMLA